MIGIRKGDGGIDRLIETTYEDTGSGMPWDDDPSNIIEHRSFKESGVFIPDEEAERLDKWLTDYSEMLYFNGKSNRIGNKADKKLASEVVEFLSHLRLELTKQQ